ncbi:TIGR00266 family protein [Clostridium sp. DL1XJH146]
MSVAHEIDYQITGEEMQFVEIELDPNESVLAEAGAMMYMDEKIKMETIFGDGSGKNEGKGFMGKLFGAGKRLVTGEGLFMTVFSNVVSGKAHVAFASPYPGKIIPVDLNDVGGKLICQKDAFLCAAKGVSIGIELQKKIGVGFFGGEGFIMQKLEGDGLAFLHAGGTVVRKELKPGETLKLDTGCLVAMTQSVNYDLAFVGDIKSGIFGGEGLFLATLQGPGSIWLQSLPFSRMANRIYSAAGSNKGETKGRSSALDDLSGLADLFGNR